MSEWALIKNLKPVTAFLKKYPKNKKFLLKALRSSTGKKLQLGTKLQELAEENGRLDNLLVDVFETQESDSNNNVATFCKALLSTKDQYKTSKENKLLPLQKPDKPITNDEFKSRQGLYPTYEKARVEKEKFTSEDVATQLGQLNQQLENVFEKPKSKQQEKKIVDFKKSLDTDTFAKKEEKGSETAIIKQENGKPEEKTFVQIRNQDTSVPSSSFGLDGKQENEDDDYYDSMVNANKNFFDELDKGNKEEPINEESKYAARGGLIETSPESSTKKKPVFDSLPIESEAQKAFDNVNFDLFSHVVPGYGNGVDNKLFRMDNNRKRKIEWQDPMYLPRQPDGPEQGIAPAPSQFKNVMGINDINEFIAYKSNKEKKDAKYKNRGKIVSVLPGEPFYQPSSKGLPTRQMSNFIKVVDNRTPLISQDLPCGMYLKRPRITSYDPCVNLENHSKVKYNKLNNIYAYQTVNGLNWMQ